MRHLMRLNPVASRAFKRHSSFHFMLSASLCSKVEAHPKGVEFISRFSPAMFAGVSTMLAGVAVYYSYVEDRRERLRYKERHTLPQAERKSIGPLKEAPKVSGSSYVQAWELHKIGFYKEAHEILEPYIQSQVKKENSDDELPKAMFIWLREKIYLKRDSKEILEAIHLINRAMPDLETSPKIFFTISLMSEIQYFSSVYGESDLSTEINGELENLKAQLRESIKLIDDNDADCWIKRFTGVEKYEEILDFSKECSKYLNDVEFAWRLSFIIRSQFFSLIHERAMTNDGLSLVKDRLNYMLQKFGPLSAYIFETLMRDIASLNVEYARSRLLKGDVTSAESAAYCAYKIGTRAFPFLHQTVSSSLSVLGRAKVYAGKGTENLEEAINYLEKAHRQFTDMNYLRQEFRLTCLSLSDANLLVHIRPRSAISRLFFDSPTNKNLLRAIAYAEMSRNLQFVVRHRRLNQESLANAKIAFTLASANLILHKNQSKEINHSHNIKNFSECMEKLFKEEGIQHETKIQFESVDDFMKESFSLWEKYYQGKGFPSDPYLLNYVRPVVMEVQDQYEFKDSLTALLLDDVLRIY